MKSIFSAAILLVLLAFGCKQGDNGNSGAIKLRFNSDGHFKIAQFTDLHWEDASPNSARTKEVILHILAAEQPDLAIVTGDVVTAPPAAEGWESIAKIFEEAKMPCALTLGNHDDE